jgi:hypothetical protein
MNDLRNSYLRRYGKDEITTESVNSLLQESTNILYEQARKQRPAEAAEALRKEIHSACAKRIWHGVKEEDLTKDQIKLILPIMKNYIEKYKPSGEFEKSKVRVLMRGDLQYDIGETEGPVARIESILMIMVVAIQNDWEIFKIDITSAYMNTPVEGSDVKHKWALLDKDVVEILLELDRKYWMKYLRSDGKILVEMDKLMYGFKEAAHYLNKVLVAVFVKKSYVQLHKDSCVLMRKDGDKKSICAITVDDCLFVVTRQSGWKQEQIDMLREAFGGITVDEGDIQEVIGIKVESIRDEKYIKISQRHYAHKIAEKFKIKKGARSPSTIDLYGEDSNDTLLEDQREFMSINAYCMYGAKRTYPEILPAVVTLSARYNKATVGDMKKAVRVAEYIFGTKEDHCLILKPKSLQIVACSDASYAEHADARSHTGGVVGFESDTGCWVIAISCKQPFVTQSAGEAELVAVNRVGNYVEWAIKLMKELGYKQEPVSFFQDSECSLKMLKNGTGSFKRAKHIKVRWFWLKELIDAGIVVMKWISGLLLVADLLTKPVTGTRFKELRQKVLGWFDIDRPVN